MQNDIVCTCGAMEFVLLSCMSTKLNTLVLRLLWHTDNHICTHMQSHIQIESLDGITFIFISAFFLSY